MIIFRDVLTGDELFSDLYELKPVEGAAALLSFDCKNIQVSLNEDIQLEGANASAEGEDAEEAGESATEQKLDVEHSYRLNNMNKFGKPSKKEATGDFKKFAKGLVEKLKSQGKTEEAAEFQKQAPEALKKILGNWDNYDVYCGESAVGEVCMWILVDYREDGVTPYATVWKHAIFEEKV